MEFLNKHIHSDFITEANKIPDNTIDLTVTSPPYDDIRSYNDKVKTKDGEKYSFNFDGIVDELYRITKDGGVVVWVVGDQVKNGGETGNSFRQALSFISKGFLLYDTMIYMKNGAPFPEKRRYSQVFEYMFVFSKGKPKTFNPIMKKNVTAGAVRHSRKFRTADGEMKPGFNGKPINEYGIENNIWFKLINIF